MLNIQYHPDDIRLGDFVSGSLPLGQNIAIAAHMHLCQKCKARSRFLETLAAELLVSDVKAVQQQAVQSEHEETPTADLLSATLGKIEEQEASSENEAVDAHRSIARQPSKPLPPELEDGVRLPKIVSKLLANQNSRELKWKRLSPSLQIARLTTGDRRCEVALHRIKPGGRVMQHDHRGAEVTLVLKGSFSDRDGVYQEGDYLLRQPGEVHQPMAAANHECVCLTVTEAPVSFVSRFARLFNFLLRFHPA